MTLGLLTWENLKVFSWALVCSKSLFVSELSLTEDDLVIVLLADLSAL